MIHLADPAATEAVGASLAAVLRIGDVVALSGPLGAGKTSFARGLIAALGFQGEVSSPSFPLIVPYAPPELALPVWHVDLYRIEAADEIAELGLDEARDDAVLLIEWAERMGTRLWRDALRIALAPDPGGGRRLTAHRPPSWEARWTPR